MTNSKIISRGKKVQTLRSVVRVKTEFNANHEAKLQLNDQNIYLER